jgi:hypothetical protein
VDDHGGAVTDGADRIDLSLLGGARFTRLEMAALAHELVVIGRSADGVEHRGFRTRPHAPVPLHQGLGVALDDAGRLRHVGAYDAGACISALEISVDDELAVFTQGRRTRTGEVFSRGTVETLSPWSDNDAPLPTTDSFHAWVRARVAAVLSAA